MYEDEKDQVKLQMAGKKLSIKNMVNNLNKMGSPMKEDYSARYVELPYSGIYYLNYLQAKLGLPNVAPKSHSFPLPVLWAPLVKSHQV